jgi:outer membrane phospholipase A
MKCHELVLSSQKQQELDAKHRHQQEEEDKKQKEKQNEIKMEIISLYSNLNTKYRLDAYESLGQIKEIKNMNEFKLKLLFSVIVVSVILI